MYLIQVLHRCRTRSYRIQSDMTGYEYERLYRYFLVAPCTLITRIIRTCPTLKRKGVSTVPTYRYPDVMY